MYLVIRNLEESSAEELDELRGEIPTKVSELENDKKYISEIPDEYVTEKELAAKGYLTEHQDLSTYAKKATTLAGYGITDGATKEELSAKSQVQMGTLENLQHVSVLKIYQVTQEEYNAEHESGTFDESALYLTPEEEYALKEHTHSAADVGADSSGTAESKVSAHNTNTEAHNDIRLLIEELNTRINTIANSEDVDLDQLAELVDYIKANRSLIESITTSKVSVSDIIDNLTTNVSNKPLSAAQGVVIKALIDALQTAVNGKAEASHGNHVPTTEAADNARFLRNDNTWQTVTPENIGMKTESWTFTLEDGSTVEKKVYVG